MAARQSIPPFPDDIGREQFGHWVSDFVDGEGRFFLGQYRHSAGYINSNAFFQLSLRADDLSTLKLIQSYWGCGVISATKPTQRPREKEARQYRVYVMDDLTRV